MGLIHGRKVVALDPNKASSSDTVRCRPDIPAQRWLPFGGEVLLDAQLVELGAVRLCDGPQLHEPIVSKKTRERSDSGLCASSLAQSFDFCDSLATRPYLKLATERVYRVLIWLALAGSKPQAGVVATAVNADCSWH